MNATTISIVFLILGAAGSYGLSGAFVYPDSTKSDIGNLMVVECGLICLIFILTLLFFRNKPSILNLNNTETKEFVKNDLAMVFKTKVIVFIHFSHS
jgi:hypothetical protein